MLPPSAPLGRAGADIHAAQLVDWGDRLGVANLQREATAGYRAMQARLDKAVAGNKKAREARVRKESLQVQFAAVKERCEALEVLRFRKEDVRRRFEVATTECAALERSRLERQRDLEQLREKVRSEEGLAAEVLTPDASERAAVKERRALIETRLREALVRKAENDARRKRSEEEIAKAKVNAPCPTCKRALDEGHVRGLLAQEQEVLEKIARNVERIAAAERALRAQLDLAVKAEEDVARRVQEAEVARLRKVAQEERQKRVHALEGALAELAARLVDLAARRDAAKKELEQLPDVQAQWKDARAQLEIHFWGAFGG
ncbi:MAG: hypothetical protein HC945_02780 [Nitrosarchaeum sp.]|nr:hypothetical protein [Nitrosarchaeum sp.]